MQILKFEFGDYDGSTDWLFGSVKPTSRAQWHDACRTAMIDSFADYMEQLNEFSWANVHDWMRYAVPYLEKMGYAQAYVISFYLSNSCIYNKDDIADTTTLLEAGFSQTILDRMQDWNEKLSKKMDDERVERRKKKEKDATKD